MEFITSILIVEFYYLKHISSNHNFYFPVYVSCCEYDFKKLEIFLESATIFNRFHLALGIYLRYVCEVLG